MEKIQVLFILTFLPCGHQLFEKRKQFMPIPNEIVSSSCYWQIIETTVKNRIPSELDLFRKWGKLGWIWFILVVAVQPQTILQIHTAIASITRASDHMVLLTENEASIDFDFYFVVSIKEDQDVLNFVLHCR